MIFVILWPIVAVAYNQGSASGISQPSKWKPGVPTRRERIVHMRETENNTEYQLEKYFEPMVDLLLPLLTSIIPSIRHVSLSG